MRPDIQYDLNQVRITELRRQAQHDALAHACRARRQQGGHSRHGIPAIVTRRVLSIVGARGT